MPRADSVTALALIALGAGTVAESLRMPRFEALGVNPYTVPGIVPGLLGATLVALGAALLLRAARAGGFRRGGTVALLPAERFGRVALALALTLGYAVGLVGWLPFWLATFVFVFLFITAFEWTPDRDGGAWARALGGALLEAVLVAGAVTIIFQEVFLVRLP